VKERDIKSENIQMFHLIIKTNEKIGIIAPPSTNYHQREKEVG